MKERRFEALVVEFVREAGVKREREGEPIGDGGCEEWEAKNGTGGREGERDWTCGKD